MSLVDYASSSDEEGAEIGEAYEEMNHQAEESKYDFGNLSRPQACLIPQNQTSGSSSYQKPKNVSQLPSPPIEKLLDASTLLNLHMSQQLTGSDHVTRVVAAMAENASRKRDANGSGSSIRNKIPRGKICHSKNIPDIGGGELVPPQLRGRSNVVTEDIGKLFVKRHPQGSA